MTTATFESVFESDYDAIDYIYEKTKGSTRSSSGSFGRAVLLVTRTPWLSRLWSQMTYISGV